MGIAQNDYNLKGASRQILCTLHCFLQFSSLLTLLLPPTEKQECLSDELQQEVCPSLPRKMWWIRAPARQSSWLEVWVWPTDQKTKESCQKNLYLCNFDQYKVIAISVYHFHTGIHKISPLLLQTSIFELIQKMNTWTLFKAIIKSKRKEKNSSLFWHKQTQKIYICIGMFVLEEDYPKSSH